MLWLTELEIEVLNFTKNIIVISINDGYCKWSLVRFYGPLYQASRRKAWEPLHALLESINEAWICYDDFNVLFFEVEKNGGKIGSSSTPFFLRIYYLTLKVSTWG